MGQNGWQMGGTASPDTSLLPMALGIFGSPPLPPSPSVAAGALPGRGPGVSLASGASERSWFCCQAVAAPLYRGCCAN